MNKLKNNMKLAFWGLGSIATRHIQNVVEVLNSKNVDFEIDVFRHNVCSKIDSSINNFISNVLSEDELEKHGTVYDVIFITNPTSLHYKTIKKCVPYARNLFIEKPVFEKWDEDIADLKLNSDSVYYVACPLRYTSVLQYIKENIDLKKVFSIRAISSSYLPAWRPNVDYRTTYSAHRDLGGGVSIDLIHEWDYLTSFFGIPEKTMYVGGKYSGLDIDSDDLATYIGIYNDKVIELHLDYFGRKTIRECMFFMCEDTIIADIANGKVRYLKSGEVIDLTEERNAFQKREIEHFFDIVDGLILNDSTIQHAVDVLKIARNN